MNIIACGKYDLDVGGSYSRPDVFRLRVSEQVQSAVAPSGGKYYV